MIDGVGGWGQARVGAAFGEGGVGGSMSGEVIEPSAAEKGRCDLASKNVELIAGMYAAFGRGDVADVLGRMSPEIVWSEAENFPYADRNPYVGPQAILQGVFARCLGEWEGFGVEVDEILDAGETVVVLGRYVGKSKATGKSMRTQLVHVYRIAGGKIVRFQQYADTLQVARVRREA